MYRWHRLFPFDCSTVEGVPKFYQVADLRSTLAPLQYKWFTRTIPRTTPFWSQAYDKFPSRIAKDIAKILIRSSVEEARQSNIKTSAQTYALYWCVDLSCLSEGEF